MQQNGKTHDDGLTRRNFIKGDTNSWVVKILVSEPQSAAEILDVVRDRVAVNTASAGIFKRIPHIRGAVDVSPVSAKDATCKWKFKDDEGRAWRSAGIVEAAPDKKGKFILTMQLARAT